MRNTCAHKEKPMLMKRQSEIPFHCLSAQLLDSMVDKRADPSGISIPAISTRDFLTFLTSRMKSGSLDPGSFNMASFVVRDTFNGPGVNNFLPVATRGSNVMNWNYFLFSRFSFCSFPHRDQNDTKHPTWRSAEHTTSEEFGSFFPSSRPICGEKKTCPVRKKVCTHFWAFWCLL